MRREGKELKKLQRENERLRKELQKVLQGQWESEENAKDEDSWAAVEPHVKATLSKATPTVKGDPCPKCGQPTERVELGKRVYWFCSDRTGCKYRSKQVESKKRSSAKNTHQDDDS